MPELTVDLSEKSIDLLKQLTQWGIYGKDAGEVAERFIDRALVDFVDRKLVKLKPKETQEPNA